MTLPKIVPASHGPCDLQISKLKIANKMNLSKYSELLNKFEKRSYLKLHAGAVGVGRSSTPMPRYKSSTRKYPRPPSAYKTARKTPTERTPRRSSKKAPPRAGGYRTATSRKPKPSTKKKTPRRKFNSMKKPLRSLQRKTPKRTQGFSQERNSRQSTEIRRSYVLDSNCFNFGDLLGTGAFSQVNLVTIKRTNKTDGLFEPQMFGKHYAMKVIDKARTIKMKQVKSLKGEKMVLATLKHPLIVDYYASFQDSTKVYLLLEFVRGGEILHHFLNSPLGFFPPKTVRFYVCEILCALDHLHGNGFVYRDLKPENVLVSHTGHIKLVDFGFSKKLATKEKTYTMCGSVEYVAPEILTNEGHDRLCDFWSLGVLTYELSCGNLPYNPNQERAPFEMHAVITGSRVRFPRYLSDAMRDFLKKLLRTTPSQRLGALGIGEIKNHPLFDDINWDDVNALKLHPPIVPRVKSDDDTSNFNTEDQTPYFDFSKNK